MTDSTTTTTVGIITPEPVNNTTLTTPGSSIESNYQSMNSNNNNTNTNWQCMTRTIAHYERLEQIGLGTYGQVYRAICKDTGRIVAMKKMRNNFITTATTTTTTIPTTTTTATNNNNNSNKNKNQSNTNNTKGTWHQPTGMPLQLIREIKILKQLQHINLLSMIEVVTSKGVEHLDIDDPIPVSSSNHINNNNNNNQNEKSSSKKKRGSSKDGENDKNGKDETKNDIENTHDDNNSNNINIDRMLERERYKGNLFIVSEYMTHDLTGLLDVAYEFTIVQIKCLMRQLFCALQYMHEHKYIHRDIKSSNILLDSYFHLKLADFGLARSLEPPLLEQVESYSSGTSSSAGSTHAGNTSQDLTNKVITLWYRPPEILLGTVHYGFAVDVWSAGCILAELITGRPLATGKTEFDQLVLIADLTGTPNKNTDTWEYLLSLKKSRSTPSNISDKAIEWSEGEPRVSKLRDKYGPTSAKNRPIPESALTLLEKVLEWDPRKRITASNALQHRYFWSQPVAPDNPADLGRIDVAEDGHFHEFITKQKRKQAKLLAEQSRDKAIKDGATGTVANEKYDEIYMGIMKQVAQDGFKNDSTKPVEEEAVATKTVDVAKATATEKSTVNEAKDDKRRNNSRDRKHSRGGDSMDGVDKEEDKDDSEDRRRRQKKKRSTSDKNDDRSSSRSHHHHDRRRHSDDSEYRSEKTKRRSRKESLDDNGDAFAPLVKDSKHSERDSSNRSQESESNDKEKKPSKRHSRRDSDSGGRSKKDRHSRKSEQRDGDKKSNDVGVDTNERRHRDDDRYHRRASERDKERDDKDRYRRPPENVANIQSPPMGRNDFARQNEYGHGPPLRGGDIGGHRRPGYDDPPPRSAGGGGGGGGVYGDYRPKDRRENTSNVAVPVYGDYRPNDRRGGGHHIDSPPLSRNRERDGPSGNHFNVPPSREIGDRYGPLPPPQRRDAGPGPFQHGRDGPGRTGDFRPRDRPSHDDYPRRERDGPRGEYGGAPSLPNPGPSRRDGPVYGSDQVYRRSGGGGPRDSGVRRPDSQDSRHSRDRKR